MVYHSSILASFNFFFCYLPNFLRIFIKKKFNQTIAEAYKNRVAKANELNAKESEEKRLFNELRRNQVHSLSYLFVQAIEANKLFICDR